MKFRMHFLIEIIIFVILYSFLGIRAALIISLFHFIPTLDYIMKKINYHPELHRKLFHSIFVIAISSALVFYFGGLLIGALATLNLLLHLVLDLDGGGIIIFFPVSKYKLNFKKLK